MKPTLAGERKGDMTDKLDGLVALVADAVENGKHYVPLRLDEAQWFIAEVGRGKLLEVAAKAALKAKERMDWLGFAMEDAIEDLEIALEDNP